MTIMCWQLLCLLFSFQSTISKLQQTEFLQHPSLSVNFQTNSNRNLFKMFNPSAGFTHTMGDKTVEQNHFVEMFSIRWILFRKSVNSSPDDTQQAVKKSILRTSPLMLNKYMFMENFYTFNENAKTNISFQIIFKFLKSIKILFHGD